MESGRGGLIRSRTGCITCRIRRIKCDETRPNCNRCFKTGRTCDGYSHLKKVGPAPRKSTPSPKGSLPALPTFDDARQRDSFSFFISCTSSASSVYFGADFWSRRVLQLSLTEPSIRYALCSLSALHRMSLASQNSDSSQVESKSYALLQYNRAVKYTRDLLAEDSTAVQNKTITGLVACILFVCFENFCANYHTAQMHLQNGLQIIAREFSAKYVHCPEDICQVFQRLDLQAMSFQDSTTPYPYHLSPERPQFNPPIQDPLTLENATTNLLYIFRWIFRASAAWEPNPIPSEELKHAYRALKKLDNQIGRSLEAMDTQAMNDSRRRLTLLKIYQITIAIITATGVYGTETFHDEHLSEYENMVTLGEELLQENSTALNQAFSFDIGVIFPLFFAATKCRDPQVRRRAVKLLEHKQLQEGSWRGSSASRVAQFVIRIEEEGLGHDFVQHDICETARVHGINVSTDLVAERIYVSCLLRKNEDDVSWYTRKGSVSVAMETH